MAHWVGAQGQIKLAKKSQKHALIVTSPQKTPNPKRKNFVFSSTGRLAGSVDALNSSLAQSAGELWSWKKLQSRVKKLARAGLKRFKAEYLFQWEFVDLYAVG